MALGHLVDDRDEGIAMPYKVADEEKSIGALQASISLRKLWLTGQSLDGSGRNSPQAYSISSRSDELYSTFDPNFDEEALGMNVWSHGARSPSLNNISGRGGFALS